MIVLHIMGNATGQLLALSSGAGRNRLILSGMLVVVVVAWWGPETLRRGTATVKPPEPLLSGE